MDDTATAIAIAIATDTDIAADTDFAEDLLDDELLVEEISIDGMCGVY